MHNFREARTVSPLSRTEAEGSPFIFGCLHTWRPFLPIFSVPEEAMFSAQDTPLPNLMWALHWLLVIACVISLYSMEREQNGSDWWVLNYFKRYFMPSKWYCSSILGTSITLMSSQDFCQSHEEITVKILWIRSRHVSFTCFEIRYLLLSRN
jgi:hypothetical protein